MTMTREKLNDILRLHALWLRGDHGGKRARLTVADLSGADVSGAILTGAIGLPDAPIVPNIDRDILDAINAGGKLEMRGWHKCETTHCRAGWAVHLAGDAGYDLEAEYGTNIAGALIYAASRPGKPIPSFFADNYEAMADLVACANEGGAQ